MGENLNILNSGAETLVEIRQNLTELAEAKARTAELAAFQQQAGKDLNARQKAMDAEISKTVTARKNEIEKSFDDQISKTKERIKTVKAKRDKFKGTKVSERIQYETADKCEELKDMKRELKLTFREDRVSTIYNNGYFFSMFLPDNVGNFSVIVLTVIIVLALPFGIFKLITDALQTWWMCALIYAAVLILAMGIFVIIFKQIRNKHLDALTRAKEIRSRIAAKKKEIHRQSRSIRKDKDESTYGLENFDAEIEGLENQVKDMIAQQKQAIKDFEAGTEKDVTNEIKARYTDDIEKYKADIDKAYTEQSSAEDRIKSLTLDISTKYEAYLGKDMLNVQTIDGLGEIINRGEAVTIAEAIAVYRSRMAEAKKE